MKSIVQNLYRLQTLDAGGLTSHPEVAGLRAVIPLGMLANYDRARARGKKGIALVLNRVCTNCRMHVPVGVTASLAAGMIQVCGNCGIYLSLPERDEQSPATTPQDADRGTPRKRKASPKPRSQ